MSTSELWPDLSVDRIAMERARETLGDNSDVRELLALAQRFKDEMNKGAEQK
jgi:hypothetical protein